MLCFKGEAPKLQHNRRCNTYNRLKPGAIYLPVLLTAFVFSSLSSLWCLTNTKLSKSSHAKRNSNTVCNFCHASSQSKTSGFNDVMKSCRVMGVVSFFVKQSDENLSDVSQIEMFTEEVKYSKFYSR